MLIMEHVKKFLENSTIHGLVWISRTRRFDKVFWLLVVLGGFVTAIALIRASFYNWEQRPTITTIETLPISKITYPNVTVCPPKYSFLNLNFDIFQSEEVNISQDSRTELFEFTLDVIQEEFYGEMIKNLSKVVDPDRFYNWYQGYTKERYPYMRDNNRDDNALR